MPSFQGGAATSTATGGDYYGGSVTGGGSAQPGVYVNFSPFGGVAGTAASGDGMMWLAIAGCAVALALLIRRN